MSSHSDPSAALLLGFVGGLWTFFKGFRVFREYKIVSDTPRISIRSVPMGLVHIRGVAQVDPPVSSPVSHTPCCFYKVEIEQWKSDGKSHSWHHVRTDADGGKFYLDDQTGKALVDAHSAEFDLPMTVERVVSSEHPSAEEQQILQYVAYSGVHKFASTVEHFLEKRGPSDDPKREGARQTLLEIMQAAPAAMQGGRVPVDLVEKFMARIPLDDPAKNQKREEAIARLHQMAQNGTVPVDIHESVTGRYRLREYLVVPGQEYTITATCAENPAGTGDCDRNLICKGSHESTFLISSKSEIGTQQDLRKKALWMVLGGAGVSLICLAFLLMHLNVL